MSDGLLVEQQRLEATIARIRWGAVALAILLGPQFPNLSETAVAGLALAVAAYNAAVSWATSRTRSTEQQRHVSELAFALDLVALSAAMLIFSVDPYWTTFFVGTLVIVAGGFRFGASGAYVSALVLGIAYLAILIFRARAFDLPLEPSRAAFHLAVYGLLALLVERVLRDGRRVRAERERLIAKLEEQLRENERLLGEASEARALRELDRLKDEFLAIVSHELRTPLTVIRGSLELLARRHGDLAEDARRLVEQAERHAERLQRNVDDLLDLAQLQEAKMVLERELVRPAALLADVAAASEPLAAERSQRLVVSCAPDLPPLFVDRRRMQQVLGNLVQNATRYSPEGSTIALTAALEDRSIALAVEDEGPGIPPAERERIFDRFYRGELSKRSTRGTGLGLAIARTLVELHGGSIAVAQRDGPGARFVVRVPHEPVGAEAPA